MARQILEVSKYQSGIRPFHSILNDCLANIPNRQGRPFLIPLAGNDLDVHLLQKQIDEIQVRAPFPATNEPFR